MLSLSKFKKMVNNIFDDLIRYASFWLQQSFFSSGREAENNTDS